jgi:hypothetical protein
MKGLSLDIGTKEGPVLVQTPREQLDVPKSSPQMPLPPPAPGTFETIEL